MSWLCPRCNMQGTKQDCRKICTLCFKAEVSAKDAERYQRNRASQRPYKPKLINDGPTIDKIAELIAKGHSKTNAARLVGVDRNSVYRLGKKLDLNKRLQVRLMP